MKSARINFGKANSEYVMKIDDNGAATSLVNQDTNTEYISGGSELPVMFVNVIAVSASTLRLDKTWAEIKALAEARKVIYVVFNEIPNFINGYCLLAEVGAGESYYVISTFQNNNIFPFLCSDPDEYPSWSDD